MCNNRQAIAIASNNFPKLSKLFSNIPYYFKLWLNRFYILIYIYINIYINEFKSRNKANLSKIKKITWFKTAVFFITILLKNARNRCAKGYPLAACPSIAIINLCNKKQLFWLALFFCLFLFLLLVVEWFWFVFLISDESWDQEFTIAKRLLKKKGLLLWTQHYIIIYNYCPSVHIYISIYTCSDRLSYGIEHHGFERFRS